MTTARRAILPVLLSLLVASCAAPGSTEGAAASSRDDACLGPATCSTPLGEAVVLPVDGECLTFADKTHRAVLSPADLADLDACNEAALTAGSWVPDDPDESGESENVVPEPSDDGHVEIVTTADIDEEWAELGLSMVRTDFSDDAAWHATVAAATDQSVLALEDRYSALILVENRKFDGWTAERLVKYVRDHKLRVGHLFVADHVAQTTTDHRILVVDVELPDPQYPIPDIGRTFRTEARQVMSIAPNLAIGNMEFADFADAADAAPDQVFRGFGG